MNGLEDRIMVALRPLIGRKLSLAKNVGDVRSFCFGQVQRTSEGLTSDYILHVFCPWRIEYSGRIVVGSADHYGRADGNDDPTWEVGTAWGTHQHQVLADLLGHVDPKTQTIVNSGDGLVVAAIAADEFGGLALSMSGGYRLVLFPSASRGSEWRFMPAAGDVHFVAEDGDLYSIGSEAQASKRSGEDTGAGED